jgi:hypothetical protein
VKKHFSLFIFVILFAILGACSQNESSVSEEPTPSALTSTPVSRPSHIPSLPPSQTPEPENLNPLTGLEIDENFINRRPVVIMINNLKEALPQFGLSKADIIYEAVAEGGITRLVMVMKDPSGAGIIGSVRSTRSYYLDIAQGHDGLLLHAGASEMAYADIEKRGVTRLDAIKDGYDGSLYYRDAARRKNNGYEHSLMTSGELIEQTLAKGKYRLEHDESYTYPVKFSSDISLAGKKAEAVSVKFSSYKTAVFDYDSESGRYLVSQYKKAHMDAGTDEQLSMKNVLVLYADISAIKGDAYGRMKIDLVGSGDGIYMCGGKYVDIEWSKASYAEPFTYKNKDGSERVFMAGTSYICIVGSESAVSIGE